MANESRLSEGMLQGTAVFQVFYASSSFSSMLGIPLEMGNSRPDSGHFKQPSITSTCNTAEQTNMGERLGRIHRAAASTTN